MNKQKLIAKIIDRLRDDLALYHKAAGASRAEATDPQSKAENKYDTRGLEASYLARGQSRQMAELGQAIEKFEKLPVRNFGPADPIDTGALVELKGARENSFYFIGPRAGGTEIRHEKKEVLVITPESPLGAQLIGKKKGTRCRLEIAGQEEDFTIAELW